LSGDREREKEARSKQLRAEVANYAETVRLISSFEQWIEFLWGSDGEVASTLDKFERFARCDSLRPDFLASFRKSYRLCGEVKKTFRGGKGSGRDSEEQGGERPGKDVGQVLGYTHYLSATSGDHGAGDVLLLVHTHTVDAAAKAVATAGTSRVPEEGPAGPIVIVGYVPDARANGDWYDLKWWDLKGNSRFSEPNVTSDAAHADLNSLIVDVDHCPIRVDLEALDISSRNPLINDDPPPLYTVAYVVFPAISELLTEAERDELQTEGRVEKKISRESLMKAECVAAIMPPEGYIQDALDAMVEKGWARRVRNVDPPEYAVNLNLKTLPRDLIEILADRGAAADVAKLFGRARRRRRRASRQQLPLTFEG